MTGMADRIETILQEQYEFLGDPLTTEMRRSEDGGVESGRVGTLRIVGVAEYFVNGRVDLFKRCCERATEIEIELGERPVWGVSIYVFQPLFTALASGNIQLAEKFAAANVEGASPDERDGEHPFSHFFSWALATMVADFPYTERRDHIEALKQELAKPKFKNFLPYPFAMEAILDGDVEAANEAFGELVKRHKLESVGTKIFSDTEDEVLCVWGLGLANLARWRGLPVFPQEPLIPADLLIDTVETSATKH